MKANTPFCGLAKESCSNQKIRDNETHSESHVFWLRINTFSSQPKVSGRSSVILDWSILMRTQGFIFCLRCNLALLIHHKPCTLDRACTGPQSSGRKARTWRTGKGQHMNHFIQRSDVIELVLKLSSSSTDVNVGRNELKIWARSS